MVIYERFQLKGIDWEQNGVLNRWSLMGGGHLREVVTHGGSTVFIFRYIPTLQPNVQHYRCQVYFAHLVCKVMKDL